MAQQRTSAVEQARDGKVMHPRLGNEKGPTLTGRPFVDPAARSYAGTLLGKVGVHKILHVLPIRAEHTAGAAARAIQAE